MLGKTCNDKESELPRKKHAQKHGRTFGEMNKGMKLWRPLKTSPRFGQNKILALPSKLKKPNFRFNNN